MSFLEFFKTENIFIQIAVVLLLAVFVDFIQKKTMNSINYRIDPNVSIRHLWLDSFLSSVKTPLTLLIYLASISISLELLDDILDLNVVDGIPELLPIISLVILCAFSQKFIKKAKSHFKYSKIAREREYDLTTVDAMSKVAILFVYAVVGILILQESGISISALLAFGGAGGIIVGLAARDLLSNFFGGMVIYWDKPFSIGDWIRSPDREIEGVVEDIGWRITTIRTFDKRPLYVPNSVIASITIENPQRMLNRRIFETIGIRYSDINKIRVITKKVKTMLQFHSAIDAEQTLMVNFNAYGESSVDFFIYAYTKTTDWVKYHGIKQDILLKIHEIIEEEEAQIAYPTRVLNIENFSGVKGESIE